MTVIIYSQVIFKNASKSIIVILSNMAHSHISILQAVCDQPTAHYLEKTETCDFKSKITMVTEPIIVIIQ